MSSRRAVQPETAVQNVTLGAINRLFRESMACESSSDVAQVCLSVAQDVTGSEYGSVAEVNSEGRFDTLALSNPGWEKCRMAELDPACIQDMEIRGIWGAALESQDGLIVNDPANHPLSVGLPDGHPPLTSFLGAPFQHRKFKGMIGIANKEGGYAETDREIIEALAFAFAEVINSKRGEEELRESEQKHRLLAEQTRDVIFRTRIPEGTYEYVSPSAIDLFGYASDEFYQDPQLLLQMLPADWQQYFQDKWEEIRNGSLPPFYEFPILHRQTGKRRWMYQRNAWIKDDSGKLIALQGNVTDITKRKLAEEALKQSRAQFQAIFHSMAEAVVFVDTERRIRAINPAATKLWGYTQEELEGITTACLYVDEASYQEQGRKCYNVGARPQSPVFELRYRRKDGSMFLAESIGTQVRDAEGTVLGFVGVHRDITERKRAEQAVKESAREVEIRNAIANVFLTVSDEDMYHEVLKIVLQVMDSEYGVFGYIDENGDFVVPSMTRHIWDKCNVPDKRYIFPRDTWGDSSWPQAVREKRTINSNDPSTDTPQGHIGISRHISMPVIHKDEVIGLFQVANKSSDYSQDDIRLLDTIAKNVAPILSARLERDRQQDHREQAEQAARDAQQQLIRQEREKKERAQAELAEIRDELIRTTRLAAIGQVAASIAHELRNPLGAAGNACYYLKRYGSGEKAQLEEYLDIIKQELGTAHSVIDSLLSMARAEEPAKQDVDLGDLVNEVFRGIQTNDNVTCRITLAPEPFVVKVDSNQIGQVVANLVRNATQAMDGQGELLVEASHGAGADIIVFRDSGPGVTPEILDKLFEPLVTTKAKGTGLGLTICQQIIERHGGTIEAANRDEGGAAFTIRLPSQ